MKKAIIIHGTMGSPEINWFPWMKEQLEENGYEVAIPQLPTPENQNLDNWLKIIDNYRDDLQNGATLIGHSLGGTTILRYLEVIDFKIKNIFLVGTPIDFIPEIEEDRIIINKLNTSFVKDDFDFTKIVNNVESSYIYHGDDDPYVPLDHAETIQKHLKGTFRIIENGGHLNSEAGYTSFPELLKSLLND